MNIKNCLLIGIVLTMLFTGIVLAKSDNTETITHSMDVFVTAVPCDTEGCNEIHEDQLSMIVVTVTTKWCGSEVCSMVLRNYPLEDVKVVVKGRGVNKVVYTNECGKAYIIFTPEKTGTLNVIVTKKGYDKEKYTVEVV